MKSFSLFLLAIVVLSSCQQMEPEFSCDPVIDNFVREKKAELASLSLDQFLCYDFALQKAIFNSWDAWKKRDVWIEKLERVVEKGSFTPGEVEHIQQLIEHIHSDFFVLEKLENEKEVRTQFAKQWIVEAIKNFGWTDKYIAFIVYRLYTDEYQFEHELSELESLVKSVSTNTECNCSQSADFCGFTGGCISSNCISATGCGWLWSSNCDGTCF